MTVPLYNLVDTWNNGGTVFTGLQLNVTNTASANPSFGSLGSLLADFQIGGTSAVALQKRGAIVLGGVFGASLNNFSTGGNSSLDYGINQNGEQRISLAADSLRVMSTHSFGWTSTTDSTGTLDVTLFRDAAGILAQRNSTNAQTLRVYNTFTDASNYERGVFDWTTTANTLTIGTQQAGTGSIRFIFLNSAGASGLVDIGANGSAIARFAGSNSAVDIGNHSILGSTTGIGFGGAGISFSAAATLAVGNGTASDFSGTVKATTLTLNDVSLDRGAAGLFKFSSAGSFTANSTTATVLGSLGPAGANTTVQKWLTIKDDGGTTRYIPCF